MFFDNAFTLFLQSIGRSEEIDYYLKRFRQDQSSLFALVVPDRMSLESADLLRTHLDFLARLGLFPGVLLCQPFADEMARSFVGHRGFRIHTNQNGSDLDALVPIAKQGREIPVLLSSLSLLQSLQQLTPNASKRIHIVRLNGALRDPEGRPLFHCAPGSETLTEDSALLSLAGEILKIDSTLHLSVTSPFELLKEMFTVKGAGTIVRHPNKILHFEAASDLDRGRLRKLLEESFARRLSNDHLFASIKDFYIESRYRGAVLLEDRNGLSYLSKFAVGLQARGEGVAQELWEVVLNSGRPIFWRSRRRNTIHRWYERLADGFHRLEDWTVYWKNVAPDRIPGLIQYCSQRPEDFSDFSMPTKAGADSDS